MKKSISSLWENKQALKFVCISLLLLFFMIYGILQERIMTRPYGKQGELFKNSAFLVFCNRLVSVLFSIGVMLYNREPLQAIAPHWSYATISLCNLAATFCQYEALKYLTFPLQTVLKNGKIVMVLAVTRLLLGKKYTFKDYGLAFGIMIGCSAFVLAGSLKRESESENESFTKIMIGLAIMITYLFFDGFTSTFQEKLFRGHVMSTNHQMLFVNLYSMLLSVIGLLTSGQLSTSIKFVAEYPDFLIDALELSLCSTFGQQVIYITIKEFGNVLLSTVMTTRQMLSIVVSSIMFSHHLSIYQWLSAFGVSCCLYYSNYLKSSQPHSKPKSKESSPV